MTWFQSSKPLPWCPPTGPHSGAPFPPEGPADVQFPPIIGTTKHSDSPSPVPRSSVAFASRYRRLHSKVRTPQRASAAHHGTSLEAFAVPPRRSFGGDDGASQVPEGPPVNVPCSLTPVGPDARPMRRHGCCLPPVKRRRPLTTKLISELSHTAHSLAVYASRRRLPDAAQDSLPAAGQLCRAGLAARWVPLKSFSFSFPSVLLSQASWRT